MTRKEELEAMLVKVEAGEWDAKLATKALPESYISDEHEWISPYEKASCAYNGSLDAARALHEAVLPGWDWSVGKSSTYVVKEGFGSFGFGEFLFDEQLSMSPARAWLIAILKALIAECD